MYMHGRDEPFVEFQVELKTNKLFLCTNMTVFPNSYCSFFQKVLMHLSYAPNNFSERQVLNFGDF
jgi:hypothetical protein